MSVGLLTCPVQQSELIFSPLHCIKNAMNTLGEKDRLIGFRQVKAQVVTAKSPSDRTQKTNPELCNLRPAMVFRKECAND